jgi:dipeptidyl aminopeptidase/acylaminoacyl peptidase
LHLSALGQLTGNWLFFGARIPRPERGRIEVQIRAVPVGGGPWAIPLSFDVPLGGVPEAIFDSTPYLRRQFSPDGKRMVFSIDAQLVVVDLVTGQAKPLGVRGYFPSWSRDGSQIAFVFEKPVADVVPPPAAIGIVSSNGGSPRELITVGYERRSAEWSPDGSKLLYSYSDGSGGAAIIDVTSGNIVTRVPTTPSGAPSFAHWRTDLLAMMTRDCAQQSAKVVLLDNATGTMRTLLDTAGRCEGMELRDPRWNPAVADELLYVASRGAQGVEFNDFQTHVLTVATGKDSRLPISAYEATWTWDGASVAYLAKTAGSTFGSALRVWKRDGSGEIELQRAFPVAGQFESFFSIASVNY